MCCVQCDGGLIVTLVHSGKSLSEGYLGQVDLWACLWGAVFDSVSRCGRPSLKAGGSGLGLTKKEKVSRASTGKCVCIPSLCLLLVRLWMRLAASLTVCSDGWGPGIGS